MSKPAEIKPFVSLQSVQIGNAAVRESGVGASPAAYLIRSRDGAIMGGMGAGHGSISAEQIANASKVKLPSRK